MGVKEKLRTLPLWGCPKSILNEPYVGAENLQPLPFVWFMDFLDSSKLIRISTEKPEETKKRM